MFIFMYMYMYVYNSGSYIHVLLVISNRLVTQRTKRIDECQKLLLQMLETLTSGTEEERKEFMAVCVQTLTRFPMGDMVTPIFVFEQLCNIIHPVRPHLKTSGILKCV